MMVNCKAYLIASTTVADTLLTSPVNLDSVKKLVPRGYYILDENGAKLSVKAKIDADFWQAKWRIADDELSKRNGDLLLVTLDRNQYREQGLKDSETIRLFKQKLFWAHFWKYTGLAAAGVLGAKLLLPSF